MKSLNKLSREIHQNAVDHGWYDKKQSFGEIVALCHSELSEALDVEAIVHQKHEYNKTRPYRHGNKEL